MAPVVWVLLVPKVIAYSSAVLKRMKGKKKRKCGKKSNWLYFFPHKDVWHLTIAKCTYKVLCFRGAQQTISDQQLMMRAFPLTWSIIHLFPVFSAAAVFFFLSHKRIRVNPSWGQNCVEAATSICLQYCSEFFGRGKYIKFFLQNRCNPWQFRNKMHIDLFLGL